MKQCDEGDGFAGAKTSKDFLDLNTPNPNPNIERDKVEEIRQRQADRLKLAEVRQADVKANRLYCDIDDLLSLLTVSEKRAEEMERERNDLRIRLDIVASQFEIECRERDSARSSLMRVRGALKPFAECAATFEEDTPDAFPLFSFNEANELVELEIELGDLRKARTALQASGDG